MLTIALVHKHYDEKHLKEVKKIMELKGAPVIRAIWSECHGLWLAIEGCHRIRAAKELGLTPIIKDVSNQKTVNFQIDGKTVKVKISKLINMLEENASSTKIIDFDFEEEEA